MTGWYVASLANGDTHLAEPATQELVTARCDGRQFRPLAALRGSPVDKAQICSACLSAYSPQKTTRRSK